MGLGSGVVTVAKRVNSVLRQDLLHAIRHRRSVVWSEIWNVMLEGVVDGPKRRFGDCLVSQQYCPQCRVAAGGPEQHDEGTNKARCKKRQVL